MSRRPSSTDPSVPRKWPKLAYEDAEHLSFPTSGANMINLLANAKMRSSYFTAVAAAHESFATSLRSTMGKPRVLSVSYGPPSVGVPSDPNETLGFAIVDVPTDTHSNVVTVPPEAMWETTEETTLAMTTAANKAKAHCDATGEATLAMTTAAKKTKANPAVADPLHKTTEEATLAMTTAANKKAKANETTEEATLTLTTAATEEANRETTGEAVNQAKANETTEQRTMAMTTAATKEATIATMTATNKAKADETTEQAAMAMATAEKQAKANETTGEGTRAMTTANPTVAGD
jgi:hypothetical protein